MSNKRQEIPEFKDAEIMLDKQGKPIAIAIPAYLAPDGDYHLEVTKGHIDITKDGKSIASIILSDDIPKEVYDSLSEQPTIAMIPAKDADDFTGTVMCTASMHVDKDSTSTAPAMVLTDDVKEEEDTGYLPLNYHQLKQLMQEEDDEKIKEHLRAVMEEYQKNFHVPDAANNNQMHTIKTETPENFVAQAQSATPLQPGDDITGRIDSIAPLGASQDMERAEGLAKAIGGFAIPIATTMAVKMIISMAVTTAIPVAAPILVPVLFAGYSTYKLGKKATKKQGNIFKKILGAAKENKFHAGMLLGSLAVGILLRTGGLDPAADFITEKIQDVMETGNPEVSAVVPGNIIIDGMDANTGLPIGGVTETVIIEKGLPEPDTGMPAVTNTEPEHQAVTDNKPAVTDTEPERQAMTDNKPAVADTEPEQRPAVIDALPAEYADLSPATMKDKAFELFNGRGGEVMDRDMAVKLYEEAATHGSISAQVDLAYIQYHGLGGIEQNSAAAVQTMRELGRTEWLGGQKIPELNPQDVQHSVTEDVRVDAYEDSHTYTSTSETVLDSEGYTVIGGSDAGTSHSSTRETQTFGHSRVDVDSEGYTVVGGSDEAIHSAHAPTEVNMDGYAAFPEGSSFDQTMDERLVEAIQSGQTTPEDGIVTIDAQSNKIYFTHANIEGDTNFTTHVINMDQYKDADFLGNASIGLMDGPSGYNSEEMATGLNSMLELAAEQGGDPHTGVVIGFVNDNPGADMNGNSIDIHAYRDASGEMQYNLITDDYFQEHGDAVKTAAQQTLKLKDLGNPIIFNNDFVETTQNMDNNAATVERTVRTETKPTKPIHI